MHAQALPVERRIAGKEFFEEGRLTTRISCEEEFSARKAIEAGTTQWGPKSPPIASIAMIGADKDYSSEPLSTTLRPR